MTKAQKQRVEESESDCLSIVSIETRIKKKLTEKETGILGVDDEENYKNK